MSGEFWVGFFYGVCAGAVPTLAWAIWVLDERVRAAMEKEKTK
jgi:hypothetical protein